VSHPSSDRVVFPRNAVAQRAVVPWPAQTIPAATLPEGALESRRPALLIGDHTSCRLRLLGWKRDVSSTARTRPAETSLGSDAAAFGAKPERSRASSSTKSKHVCWLCRVAKAVPLHLKREGSHGS
jgi:hypothetical protein